MIKLSRLVGASVLLGALTACATTPTAWTKAGASAEDALAAERECQVLARDENWLNSWDSRWPPSFYDPAFMPSRYHGRTPFWRDYPSSPETEWDLRNFCMHSKGYRLSPIGPAQS